MMPLAVLLLVCGASSLVFAVLAMVSEFAPRAFDRIAERLENW